MEPAAVAILLLDDRRVVLSGGALTILDRAGAVVIRVEMSDITGINRGGSDLIITRREADPVVITAAALADAQRFIVTLREQQRPPQPPRNRWRPRRMQR